MRRVLDVLVGALGCLGTLLKIRETEKFEDFCKYFELEKDEIRLKNLKFKNPRKRRTDIGSKNVYILSIFENI